METEGRGKMLIPVIMAGGTGSRLWPLSRELHPKQFLNLCNEYSMLQETVVRLDGLDIESPIIICNEEHRFLAAEQLREIEKSSSKIILEPIGRNTAPAIALAALHAIKNDYDPLLLILAADHIIENKDEFHHVIKKAVLAAEKNKLVTFGIVAETPETGYGYIQKGEESKDNLFAFSVKAFVEKPDAETAQRYIESDEYYWNSGMFLFKASKYLDELKKYRPDIYDACEASIEKCNPGIDFIRVDKNEFFNCPSESIDYAVMEKTEDSIVIPLNAGWNDVGSWSAIWDVNKKDANNNFISGDVFADSTTDSYLNANGIFVSAIGVTGLIIIATKDSVLVIDKHKVQDVKKVVDFLKSSKRKEHKEHKDCVTDWGIIENIENKENRNIIKLTIKPGKTHKKNKNNKDKFIWNVLSGNGVFSNGYNDFYLGKQDSLSTNEEFDGDVFFLKNTGESPLEIIEVCHTSV